MKWIALIVLLCGCAELEFDAHLPDVYIEIGIDGGVDGGHLDVGIDDIDFRGHPPNGVELVENENEVQQEITSAAPSAMPALPVSPR
jgi:hypothetical protein